MCRRPSGSRWVASGSSARQSASTIGITRTSPSVSSLPGSRPQVAPAALRRRHRPARRHADAAQRDRRRSRIAQSFVFSGPRGVGKTTTARILARGLNCEKGPTADPCGDVRRLRRDRAGARHGRARDRRRHQHPGRQGPRRSSSPASASRRCANRYKIFIIDEVHRLSTQAFDALLKSIEEPPPHVVFMMATTEIEKVPATIQSRSQVFELKTIGVKPIADQLRRIADAEKHRRSTMPR